MVKALKTRNKYWRAGTEVLFRAFSASEFVGRLPGALPQAVAFRTFGAEPTINLIRPY